MRMTWLIAGALGLVACGNLDSIDNIADLRMLAVRTEPPDQLVDPNALLRGAQQGLSSTTPVQLTALLADPKGAGRPINYTVATCAMADTNTQRCYASSPGYQRLASGTTAAPSGWVELPTTFAPSDAFLAQAISLDTYHGFDGLRVPVQISVTAGNDSVLAVKLAVYALPYPGITYTANQNPNIAGVTVESVVWPSPGTFTFSSAVQPKDGWNIAPTFDASAQVAYQVPSFQGTVLNFTESWLFDYFSTFGAYFSPTTNGGFQIATNVGNAADSNWNPGKATSLSSGNFYIVVRDGRGGENWVVLDAEWGP